MRKPLTILFLLILLSIVSFLFALSVGSLSLSFNDILKTLMGDGSDITRTVIYELRLPRAYVAFITGALLSLAGMLMQVLLRNPLADPYILGVSGGASVGAILAIGAGLATGLVSASAFVGALISITLVFGLAHGRGSWNPSRLLLTGVVVASGWGATINFILSVSPDQSLKGMLFWLMGDLSYAHSEQLSNPVLPLVLIIGLALSLIMARSLNVLSRGEMQASVLGISLKPLRLSLFLLASALTAIAVTQAGSIGFVGLIIPHMMRLLISSDHRWLAPACVFAGGSLLLLSDTLARSIIAPQQLPVGVITAFIGVPLFLFLLSRGYKQQEMS
ncbi:MAG: ABC transporter permease [endosymbiont of Galathealinum brachiosum]|uniref:ABC transporter permease n=1 Tax=endosymbiont of Galathealinum brachiosum TaxID=2200906 RepID=A0A370DBG8_9GAMM|nr:MAG: ABC transporter permease [endosymbiont of Galathealinum brachiosum]